MGAFSRDPNSRVSLLTEYVRDQMHDVGDVITYQDLAALIDVEFDGSLESITLLSGVVSGTNDRLSTDGDWKALHSVPKVGYKIPSAAELYDERNSRLDRSIKQQRKGLSAVQKVISHPDASQEDRKRAADSAAAQGSLLAYNRKQKRSLRGVWKRPESSPVVEDTEDD